MRRSITICDHCKLEEIDCNNIVCAAAVRLDLNRSHYLDMDARVHLCHACATLLHDTVSGFLTEREP